MIRKALRIVEAEEQKKYRHIRRFGMICFVLRSKSKFDKLTSNLINDYKRAMCGEAPRHYERYNEAESGSKEEIHALIDICQSMHMVLLPSQHDLGHACHKFTSSSMNPGALVCTCKGFRMIGECAHIIAVTCTEVIDAMCVDARTSYNKAYLETLVEKLTSTKRAAHRPCATVGGSRIQPDTDTVQGNTGEDTTDLDEDLEEL